MSLFNLVLARSRPARAKRSPRTTAIRHARIEEEQEEEEERGEQRRDEEEEDDEDEDDDLLEEEDSSCVVVVECYRDDVVEYITTPWQGSNQSKGESA